VREAMGGLGGGDHDRRRSTRKGRWPNWGWTEPGPPDRIPVRGQGSVRTKVTKVVEASFVPVPAPIPVRGHNPEQAWAEGLSPRLTVQNAPPRRLWLLAAR